MVASDCNRKGLEEALEAAMDAWEAHGGDCTQPPVLTSTQLVALLDVPGRADIGCCSQSSFTPSEMVFMAEIVEAENREHKAMEAEDERGRRFRDWQSWAEDRARMRGCGMVEIRVRARIRHRGLAGAAKALSFLVQPGDTMNLSLAVRNVEETLGGRSKTSSMVCPAPLPSTARRRGFRESDLREGRLTFSVRVRLRVL